MHARVREQPVPHVRGLRARVEGVALIGPGLPDWSSARAVLAGELPWAPAPTAVPPATALPPAERRRTGGSVRIALAAGFAACAAAGRDPASLPSVFASSGGDGENCHALCEALAEPQPAVSPTRFTNSVHNAPSGYWGIASRAMAASTSVCMHDASFVAGLLEALGLLAAGGHEAVLLVAHDGPYPLPIGALRPIPDAFAVALVLGAGAGEVERPGFRFDAAAPSPLSSPHAAASGGCSLGLGRTPDAGLEALERAIPAARALPWLRWLATPAAPAEPVLLDGAALGQWWLRPESDGGAA